MSHPCVADRMNRLSRILARVCVTVCVLAAFGRSATADDFTSQDRFFAILASPMNSLVDGKSFRGAIQGIAEQTQLNVCIDRRVDPTAPVNVGPVGPSVYAAIAKIAATRDCVVMPVAGVLLVGREEWVDTTTDTLLSLPATRVRGAAAEVRWDDLTTSSDALQQAAGTRVGLNQPIPYDLWPETKWKPISRAVAVSLVLAQFDLKAQATTSFDRIQLVPATGRPSSMRRYAKGMEEAVRQAMTAVDPKSRVRPSAQWCIATGTAKAHRNAAERILAEAKPDLPDPNQETFTVKRVETNAFNVLNQLAQTAGRKCVIDDNARKACETIVVLEGTDQTLSQLAKLIAQQAGLVTKWTPEALQVSLAN